MNGDTTVTITFLFAIVAVIGTIFGIYNSVKSNRKRENDDQRLRQETEMQRAVKNAENFAKINSKLDELCITTKAIQTALEKQGEEIKDLRIDMSEHQNNIDRLINFKKEAEKILNDHEKDITIIKEQLKNMGVD